MKIYLTDKKYLSSFWQQWRISCNLRNKTCCTNWWRKHGVRIAKWRQLIFIHLAFFTPGSFEWNCCLHVFASCLPLTLACVIGLECYMDWFPSLICKNYIFKHFVKSVEPMSLKFCTIIELITLHLEYTTAQVKYANFSYAHAQTFVLLNGEMATVSTGFRKLKFWLWLLWTVFYLNQTGVWKIFQIKLYWKANKEILIYIN